MRGKAWLKHGLRGWQAYGVATLLIAIVATARYGMRDLVGSDVPLLPFIVAVLGAALVGGLQVGLFATLASTVVGEILFIRPAGISVLSNAAEMVRCGMFVAEGVLASAVIRALREARAEAIRANEQKDAFIAMVAHEFRNPINAMHTALGVMKARQSEERRTWAREMLERQAGVMSRLVDDLLDTARIRRQAFEQLQVQPIPLRPVVEAAIASSQSLIDAHGLKFEAHLDDHAIVMADPIRLQQAIGNVLGNACRYTPPGGRITVAVAVGSMVTVTVRDTGVGIAAADLSRVFEPFERGPHSTGLGLGLFLARSIVQSTGGSLDVISAGEGAGSTFIIRLPLLRHSTQEEPAAQSTRSA